MATVQIRINGRDYAIACDDGQEEHLRELADDIDDRIRSLVFRMGGNPGEGMALLLTALTMADELSENRKEIDYLTSVAESSAPGNGQARPPEMESAVALTLDQIAERIEKIARRMEMQ